MNNRISRVLGMGLIAAGLAGCASGEPAVVKPPAPAAATAVPVPSSTPTAEPPVAVQVADFKVTAYQGEETFGGSDGHLGAAFDAGRPVVLLYYGGI